MWRPSCVPRSVLRRRICGSCWLAIDAGRSAGDREPGEDADHSRTSRTPFRL
uniref:Uncharacterized protein n=1 Tax=Arundo donax TaxID=35708 RepID=A0A0A8YAW3_ARUDO